MTGISEKLGLKPQLREQLEVFASALNGDILIDIKTAEVTPSPTSSAWNYTVGFELVDSEGRLHNWINQDIAAAAGDTSTAGTASVGDATPAVVNGKGTVVLSGDAADWLDTETATLTLNGSISSLGVTLTDATWVVTFTA